MCVTCHIYMPIGCIIPCHVWHDWFICVTCHIYLMCLAQMCYISYILTWLMYIYMPIRCIIPCYVWRHDDWHACVVHHMVVTCDMTHSCSWHIIYILHDSVIVYAWMRVYVCVIHYPNTLQHIPQHTWEGIACHSTCMPGENVCMCVCVCVCVCKRVQSLSVVKCEDTEHIDGGRVWVGRARESARGSSCMLGRSCSFCQWRKELLRIFGPELIRIY